MADEDDRAEIIVGAIALVVSCVALLLTTLQVLQTYFASATGYARCGPKVMGDWAKSTRRILRPYELRFEVQFETPVIFLAHPNNNRGPVPDEPIWYIDGTPKSRNETRSLLPDEQKQNDDKLSRKKRIQDNERASWVVLLAALQQMEHDSEQWQSRFYTARPGNTKPQKFAERTLAVAVQKKVKSWDTMPAAMTKPYATTTMCHLIELASVLGLHWREFSRCENRYRAEGNGFILTGSVVNELGLVFTFQKTARTLFEEERVIPNEAVKQFCFGVVPTIFGEPEDETEDVFRYPFDVPQSLAAIKLGSSREVADTLTVMGCNTNTVDYLLKDHQKMGHLFPVAFEILGMLSRTLHGHGSGFRMLPNPTTYRWDKKSFSLWKLLEAFEDRLEQDDNITNTDQIQKIKRSLEHISKARGPELPLRTELTVPLMDTLHDALDSTDKYLTGGPREFFVLGILRSHFHVLLRHLNDAKERENFDALNSLGLEDKQGRLMEIYFDTIRKEVVKKTPQRMPTLYRPQTGNVVMPVPHTADSTTGPAGFQGGHASADSDSITSLVRKQSGFTEKNREDQLNDIWCSFVFRMLCWLLLHDFHKEDIQLPKSELLGSRLPVYIV
ncbi:uncharacterized protein B0I36DRAFT_325927 [Microdochium trichocladiopsis]|uniref:Modin n=1 Tax=Microdochium trichocladiopsis TaxID=1682393 RepID=A0A9P9BPR7_9PEZI|nr:uncharacterized protein B0I36DRAFT_325927 [Microdochium trichocladiopsis]KAH7029517.1 hypothetical protein B0I36DRAFT_325927 [Microdochium trichocladiopsis]